MLTDVGTPIQQEEISWVALQQQYAAQRTEILNLVDKVFASGEFINTKSVEMFEKEVSEFIGVDHTIAVNSGTDALIFAMRALGIGAGDEVITPPNSFIASTSSVVHVGAIPVFVDVCADQNIDPDKIEAAITNKTKAIMVVHLTGRVAQMDAIMDIAKRYNLYVIEDAAQAFGSKLHDLCTGAIGDVGCFSAHPLKNFNSAGDAGFITTNNTDVAAKCRLYRNHGLIDRSNATEWGYVSRLSSIQAELLRFRLANDFENTVKQRRKNADLYTKLLNTEHVYIPAVPDEMYHTYQCFVIQVEERDRLQAYLKSYGIITAVHYPVPIHLQPAAKSLNYKEGDFPQTERQSKSILTIPVHQYLGEREISIVSEKINSFFK